MFRFSREVGLFVHKAARGFISDSHPTQMARELEAMKGVDPRTARRLANLVHETRGDRPATEVLPTIQEIHEALGGGPITSEVLGRVQREVDERHPVSQAHSFK